MTNIVVFPANEGICTCIVEFKYGNSKWGVDMSWIIIIRDILDIAIVAYVIYRLMLLLKGTRAVELLKGLAVLFIASVLSYRLGFTTINWILKNITTMLFVALPIVFHPELRRALEKIGRGHFFGHSFYKYRSKNLEETINEITTAAFKMSERHWGALLVIERETGLTDYTENSISLDCIISSELLMGIFTPGSPLHDGATIISGDRVMAAGCLLPLTDNPNLSIQYGTRHRAAFGLAENSDALVIVVSEESGIVTLALDNRQRRYFDVKSLKDRLLTELRDKKEEKKFFKRIFNWGRKASD